MFPYLFIVWCSVLHCVLPGSHTWGHDRLLILPNVHTMDYFCRRANTVEEVMDPDEDPLVDRPVGGPDFTTYDEDPTATSFPYATFGFLRGLLSPARQDSAPSGPSTQQGWTPEEKQEEGEEEEQTEIYPEYLPAHLPQARLTPSPEIPHSAPRSGIPERLPSPATPLPHSPDPTPCDALRDFVHTLDNPHTSWQHPTKVSDLYGVSTHPDGSPRDLRWAGLELSGPLSWSHLPPTVVLLDLGPLLRRHPSTSSRAPAPRDVGSLDGPGYCNALTGPLPTPALPRALQSLTVSWNRLEGEVDLGALPPALVHCDLSHNFFVGELDLTSLPQGLENLDVSHNRFTGTPDLGSLPPSLHTLDVSHNGLCGTVEVGHLPQGLEVVNLLHSGIVEMRGTPRHAVHIQLHESSCVVA